MHTVLYVGGTWDGAEGPLQIGGLEGAQRIEESVWTYARTGAPRWRGETKLITCFDASSAVDIIRSQPVDVLVLEARSSHSSEAEHPYQRFTPLLSFLYPDDQGPGPIPKGRVIGLVGADRPGAEFAYRFGRHGISSVLVQPDRATILESIDDVLRQFVGGRIALCLAGGGIEGLFYEIGVIRALSYFLRDRAIVDFDLFYGISAGAVLGAFLANGVGPDELSRGLSGGSARVEPIRRRDIFDPNYREFGTRCWDFARESASGRLNPRAMTLSRFLPAGVFAGDRIRNYMHRQLTRPGMSNEFSALRRPLYVGATDEDTSHAVVFGEGDLSNVPVHLAVRASTALVPFYPPEKIGDRFYVDGSFSRTTNMRVAVRHGATLVILVDPLVPISVNTPGYVHRRGGIFSTTQGLKALISGRFDKAHRALRDMFPGIAFHLFRPEGEEMKFLEGSPMKYFYRREVEEFAFQSTVRKIRASLPQLERDFADHGVTFRDPDAVLPHRPLQHPTVEPEALGVGV